MMLGWRIYVRKRRQQYGGIYLDPRTKIWYYRRSVNGRRQLKPIGTLSEYPTKAQAEKASNTFKTDAPKPARPTFAYVARRYMTERMPIHPPTANAYRNYLENYVIPEWGPLELTELAAKPLVIEKWLDGVERSQKTKTHIKGVMRLVYEYAMADGLFEISRNPLELVKVKGASKRRKPKRVITYDEWARFIANVTSEPQRTAIITCFCLGVRREEVWALKWSDFDFGAGTVMIQRTIIGGQVYERTKNEASEAPLPLDENLIRLLLDWRNQSEFNADSDWVWASPSVAGEMPLYFNAVQRDYIIPAAVAAGLGKIGWHTFRHTYRSWLNAAGTPLGIQKDLMRHANIGTTANAYGTGVVEAMRQFNSQVVKRIIQ
jgi:integrase